LASGVPALVVPFTTLSQDEQMQRATILSRMGVIRMLEESGMTPESLAAAIRQTIEFHPVPIAAKLDGAQRTCEIVAALVGDHAAATAS
jgi:predicted glycosyltransferase